MKTVAIVVPVVAILLYVVALAVVTLFQRKLLYFPNRVAVAPAAVGLPQAHVLKLKTIDGETLVAWHIAPAAGKPLILYFHGNGGGLELRNERFRAPTRTGYGLLAVEYRGYGGSSGSPSEEGLHRDAEASYEAALALGSVPKNIVVMGESLGSGVAVPLAARHEVGAVVLDSPFSSIVDVAAVHFWMFPVRLLMRDRFHSDRAIDSVHAPLLIVHGDRDDVTPIRFAEKLYALANEPKRFIRVEGAGHLALGFEILETVRWLDGVVAGAGSQ
jgi:fermentation-respiration switch protein FrsA (DUF1100 family)